jgi:hypothetical protein
MLRPRKSTADGCLPKCRGSPNWIAGDRSAKQVPTVFQKRSTAKRGRQDPPELYVLARVFNVFPEMPTRGLLLTSASG